MWDVGSMNFCTQFRQGNCKAQGAAGRFQLEFVEVVSGLQPGDEVVVSDMSNYKNKNKLKLNDKGLLETSLGAVEAE